MPGLAAGVAKEVARIAVLQAVRTAVANALRTLADSIAQDAARSAARSAAEQAAKDFAKTAAEDAASSAAQDASSLAASDISRTSLRKLVQDASQNAANLVEQAAQDGASQATKDAAASAVNLRDVLSEVETDSASQAQRDADKTLAKEAKQANALADKAAWLAKHPGLVIGAAVAAYIALNAFNDYVNSEFTQRTITKVEDNADQSGILITFTPSYKILSTDTITISGSKTDPSIDCTDQNILDSPQDNQITISASLNGTSPYQSGGTIDVSTTFSAQAGNEAYKAAGSLGATGKNFMCAIINVPFICSQTNTALIIGIIVAVVILSIIIALLNS